MLKLVLLVLASAANTQSVEDKICVDDNACVSLMSTCVEGKCVCGPLNVFLITLAAIEQQDDGNFYIQVCEQHSAVVDCALPACPNFNCAIPPVECTRTCNDGGFGGDNCPAELETKTATCPAVSCEETSLVCLDSVQPSITLLDIICDAKNMIITVPKVCRSGSFKNVDWDKSFFASDKDSTSPGSICLGEGATDQDRVYTIPLTKVPDDPASCNMEYEEKTDDNGVQTDDVLSLFFNFVMNEGTKMARIQVICSFSKIIARTSVRGFYTDAESIYVKEVVFKHPLALELYEWVKDPDSPGWSDAKKEDQKINLGSEIMLEIKSTDTGYLTHHTVGLDKCWASLSEDSSNVDTVFVFFEDKCPVIPWVKRMMKPTSAVNTRAISVIQFSFTTAKPGDSFYYHCKISICSFLDDAACILALTATECGKKKRRSSIITSKQIFRRDTKSAISERVPALKITNEECLANDGIVTSSHGLDHCKNEREQPAKTSSALRVTSFLTLPAHLLLFEILSWHPIASEIKFRN